MSSRNIGYFANRPTWVSLRGSARQQAKTEWEKEMDHGEYKGKRGEYHFRNAAERRICQALLKNDADPIDLSVFGEVKEDETGVFVDGFVLPTSVELLPRALASFAHDAKDRAFYKASREKLQEILNQRTEATIPAPSVETEPGGDETTETICTKL